MDKVKRVMSASRERSQDGSQERDGSRGRRQSVADEKGQYRKSTPSPSRVSRHRAKPSSTPSREKLNGGSIGARELAGAVDVLVLTFCTLSASVPPCSDRSRRTSRT